MNTLAAVIREHAASRPNTIALVCGDARVSYGELDRRSSQVANALYEAGVGETGGNDRVAFLDNNGVEYFELLFGAAKLNCVVVPINWRLSPSEISYIVNDAGASVFVFGAEYAELVAGLGDALESVRRFVVIGEDPRFESYARWREAGAPLDPGVAASGSDVAFQVYSSGTTGHPKGVLLSNANIFSLMPVSAEIWAIGPASVNMVAMPLFHVGGCGWAMVGLYHGCTSVIVREIDPSGLITLIGEHRITHAFLVPVLLHFMQRVPNAAGADFSSLELIVYGASPISEQVLAGALTLMGCSFAQAYGLTETTGSIVTLAPADHVVEGPHRHRLRAAGKPNPGVEIIIVSPESGEPLALGEPGEIWTRSAQNMLGYWRNAEATAATLTPEGWLKSGDIGYFDEDGFLYIHDRVKDMIISGGENVYPAEVENVLMKHESVADVAVIGIPSDVWGESPYAIVVAAPGKAVDADELRAFARQQLAKYKVPVGVEQREMLPRTPTGKLLKKDLRAPFWHGHERGIS